MRRRRRSGLRTGVRALGLTLVVAVLGGGGSLPAQVPVDPDHEATQKKISQAPNPGGQIPLEAMFRNEAGEGVRLGEYFQSDRPVILTMIYFECPMLCNLVVRGLIDSLRKTSWNPGEKFDLVTISIDPEDSPAGAAHRKSAAILDYGREQARDHWHFLTAEKAAIDPVAEAIGFGYEWNEDRSEYAHPAVIYVLTPDGRLSRYFEGIVFDPDTLRISLLEATEGKIGSVWDRITWFCLHWDPEIGKYTASIWAITRIAAGLLVLSMATLIFWLIREDKKKREREDSPDDTLIGAQS